MQGRHVTWRRHDDGTNAWCVTAAPAARALAGTVHGYSHYRERTTSFHARREMPSTQAVLILNFGGTLHLRGGDGAAIALAAGEGFLAGLHSRPAVSQAAAGMQHGIHVHLPLHSLRRLFRLDMTDLMDRVVPLDAALGPSVASLGQRLCAADPETCFDVLDDFLMARLAQSTPPDQAVAWAAARLAADPATRVEWLAARLGWSRKHLATRFRAATGAGPRFYARVRRFERLLACLTYGTRPHWADLAAAHGFADQPHLARDIRDLSGVTPTTLMQRLLPAGGGFIEIDTVQRIM